MDRPLVARDYDTAELPATPLRDATIPATRWRQAPAALLELGADLGHSLVEYKRRIGRFLLWRAGPPSRGDTRYLALAADDLDEQYAFRLHPDGSGSGSGPGPDGHVHERFRSWKEALRDAR